MSTGTKAVAAAPGDTRRAAAVRKRRRRATLRALAFASPWIVGFVALTGGPVITSAYYSFTDFNIFQAPTWVGFANYQELFDDPLFYRSLWNTLYLAAFGIPLELGLALLCALVLNVEVRGQPLYRTFMYLPSLVPIVTATYVWRWLLNTEYGFVNRVLGLVGLPQPNWLGDPMWTKPAVILIGLWGIGTTTVIYLAALKDVPKDLYEASHVDGAGPWQRFWYVTWPVITPVTLFQLVVGIINSLQIFAQPFLLVQDKGNPVSGGPDNSLLTYSLYLFQNAFIYLRMGYASAMAWLLFLVTMFLTGLILATSRRWVHYGR